VKQRPLIDAGVLIALLDSHDLHHAWANEHTDAPVINTDHRDFSVYRTRTDKSVSVVLPEA
jgi:hypothetical protein